MRFLVFRCFFDQPIVQSPNRKIAGDRKVYRVCVCVWYFMLTLDLFVHLIRWLLRLRRPARLFSLARGPQGEVAHSNSVGPRGS